MQGKSTKNLTPFLTGGEKIQGSKELSSSSSSSNSTPNSSLSCRRAPDATDFLVFLGLLGLLGLRRGLGGTGFLKRPPRHLAPRTGGIEIDDAEFGDGGAHLDDVVVHDLDLAPQLGNLLLVALVHASNSDDLAAVIVECLGGA
jgi:hypothetical protein